MDVNEKMIDLAAAVESCVMLIRDARNEVTLLNVQLNDGDPHRCDELIAYRRRAVERGVNLEVHLMVLRKQVSDLVNPGLKLCDKLN